jgi:outer membrane immunogenic protein
MRRILIAASIAMIGGFLWAQFGIAHGADLQPHAASPFKSAPFVSTYDPYTGFYIGGEIGYGFNLGDVAGGNNLLTLGPLSAAPQGFVGGGFVGLGTRFANLFPTLDGFAGIEANGDLTKLSGTAGNPSGFENVLGATVKNDWLASVRARFGLIYQNVMFYGTAGWGWGSSSFNINSNATTVVAGSTTQSGFVWGGGVEFPWFFGPGWKARLQYLQYDFGNYKSSCSVTVCGDGPLVTVTNKDRIDTVTVGLSYKF